MKNLMLLSLTTVLLALLPACDGVDETNVYRTLPFGCQLDEYTNLDSDFRVNYISSNNGQPLVIEFFFAENLSSRQEIQRTFQGKITSVEELNPFDDLRRVNRYFYQENSQQITSIETEDYMGAGPPDLYIKTYGYEAGRLAQTTYQKEDGPVLLETTYEYQDDKHQMIYRTFTGAGLLKHKYVVTYDPERQNPYLGTELEPHNMPYATIRLERFDEENGDPVPAASYTVSYKEDEANNTLEVRREYLNGDVTNYVFHYECQ